MGLAEYLKQGVVLKREPVSLETDILRSGSVDLGSVYTLLSINTNVPCRLRLYDDQNSRDVLGERSRSFGNTSVSESIGLIGDFSMSSAGTYTIDPVLYGVVQNPSSKLSYYLIDGAPISQYPKIIFNKYLLEDSLISITNRINLPTISHTLAPTQYASGTLGGFSIPRTYLLVSASTPTPNVISRIRLYATPESLTNATEISRSFATESLESSTLIVDAILSGSSVTRFVPKIVGANLKTMGNDLNIIRNNTEKIMSVNEIYYVLQNVTSSGATPTINVSLHVFSLED